MRTYQYDHANRLKQVTEGSLTTQFAYNGDGVRVGKTIGAATTDYLVDLAATLPVVISDTDAVYLYGLDIIAEQLAGADRYYYVHDGLGSVRQLVDSAGQIETKYAYDPFGVPLAGDGVPNPWQFTGEAWDAEVELVYLRARYYQPETGRFMTRDPWPGDVWRPTTLNRYLYAGNNPVNWVDPSGLQEAWRVTPDWGEEEAGTPTPGPGAIPTPRPEPSPLPRPEWSPVPADKLTTLSADRKQRLVSELATKYGIHVLGRRLWPAFRVSSLADWRAGQLYLVKEAAREFADLMQGKEATFRARIGEVGLCKAAGKLMFWGERGSGLAYPGGPIYLSGAYWLDAGGAYMKGVVVHELAHVWDFRSGKQLSGEMLATKGFWKRVDCRTPAEPQRGPERYRVYDWNVANTKRPGLNPVEDWADSVFAYVYPKRAKAISRDRWRYVADQMDPHNWWNYHFYPIEWRSEKFRDYSVERGQILTGRQ